MIHVEIVWNSTHAKVLGTIILSRPLIPDICFVISYFGQNKTLLVLDRCLLFFYGSHSATSQLGPLNLPCAAVDFFFFFFLCKLEYHKTKDSNLLINILFCLNFTIF